MTAAPQPALMAAQTLPQTAEERQVPEWIHLLPVSHGLIETADRRGPYRVEDAEAVIARSFAEADRLPIDENHASDLAAPLGAPAPARGWIVEMQARGDGIWGRVEWTKAGRELIADRAYRAISPVIYHDRDKRVVRIGRASLVNRPNLRGLAALNHQEDGDMPLLERLAELLGLEADEDAILAEVTSLNAARGEGATDEVAALQSTMREVATAFGLAAEATPEEVIGAARAAATQAGEETIAALQSELASVARELNAMREANARAAAERFVDGAIAAGRVGVKPQRDRYIALHQKDPEGTEALISALPAVAGSHADLASPPPDGELKSLNAQQREAARLIGVSEEHYLKTLQAERKKEEAR